MHRAQQTLPVACSISLRPKLGAARSDASDLAELQADMAFETYLSAFEVGDHPEVIDSLATEALIAQDRCADLRSQDLAH